MSVCMSFFPVVEIRNTKDLLKKRHLSRILIFDNDEPDPPVVKVQIQIYGINAVPVQKQSPFT